MRKFFIDKQTKMRKSFTTFMAFLLLLCAATAFGQGGTITGTVTDTNNETLIGVNVSVRGTTNGTITNIDGQFTLQGVNAQSVLVFSYIGFLSQEVPVGNQRTINVKLREDTQNLEEVIVVGYGTRKAGELTGAVSTIRSEDIQKLAVTNAGDALRNVPGLMVTQSNTPGGDANVRVRGIGTVNSTSPLWVVDGIPGGTVNPNDIETVTVLKDAAAQAIYGTRAANGVILVTTKQGKKGERAAVNVQIRTGVKTHTNHYKFLNTQEYGQLLWLEGLNDWLDSDDPTAPPEARHYADNYTFSHQLYGPDPKAADFIPDYINPLKGKNGQVDENLYKWGTTAQGANLITKANKEGTDWFKEIERPANYTDIALSLTGGSDKTTYAFTFGYMIDEGVLKYTGSDRLNLRTNIRSDVNKWLTIGQSLSATFSHQNGQINNNAEDSAVSWAYRIQPIVPVYDVGGNYAGSKAAAGPLGNARNPLGVLDLQRENKRQRMIVNGSVFAVLNIIDGLKFTTQASLTFNQWLQKNIDYYDNSHSEGGNLDYVRMSSQYTQQWNWNNNLEYKKRFDLHDFTLMVGTEALENNYYSMDASRNNYILRDPAYMDLSSGIDGQTNGSSRSSWALFSILGRLNYVYDSKYLFEGVIRRDGSSRFAGDYKYGTFPAFSVGWVLSREKFMASTRSWLDNLKIRAGYGVTGNDGIGNYNSYTQYAFGFSDDQGTYYPINGANGAQGALGFRLSSQGVDDARWETTKTTNVGFDAAFLGGFSLTFELWQRRTTDMLYPMPYPNVWGRIPAPQVNVGEMFNKGFEFNLGYRGTAMNRDLRYRLDLNISAFRNKIIKLGKEGDFLSRSERQMEYTRAQAGTALPEFYGYVVEGIFETQEEVDRWPTMGNYNKIGRYKFKDINGDGKIDASDRDFIGSPHPKFVGGLNFTFEYKGIDLTGEFYGSYGNKMINYVRRWLDYKQFIGGRSYESLYKSYGSPWLEGKATLPLADSKQENQFPSTVFLEDASYLRLRNLQIGYDLGKVVTIPTVNSLRIYLQATNLFTITPYSGLDPETTSGTGRDNQIQYGLDRGQWPTPRQIIIGLNIGL